VDFMERTAPFRIGGMEIEPLEVPHGPMTVYGYLIRHDGKSLGYIPDCSVVDETLTTRLVGVDVMILDALRDRPHPTHMCLPDTIEALRGIGAGRSYITHLCHDLEHARTQSRLPEGIEVPYDGLVIEW